MSDRKRRKAEPLKVFITLIVITSFLHLFLHIAIFGTGVPGIAESGVSGFTIGNFNLDENIKENPNVNLSPASKIFLAAQWILLAVLLSLGLLKSKLSGKREISEIEVKKHFSKSKTDIDILLEVVKEKGRIRLSSIEKSFNVEKQTALEWCKTLESGNLATIQYPSFGEPEIVSNEK